MDGHRPIHTSEYKPAEAAKQNAAYCRLLHWPITLLDLGVAQVYQILASRCAVASGRFVVRRCFQQTRGGFDFASCKLVANAVHQRLSDGYERTMSVLFSAL